MVGPIGQADFIGQDVRRPGRQRSKDRIRPGYSVDGFVDGAVATCREDEVAALRDCLTCEVTGLARGLGRVQGNLPASRPEDGNGAVQPGPF